MIPEQLSLYIRQPPPSPVLLICLPELPLPHFSDSLHGDLCHPSVQKHKVPKRLDRLYIYFYIKQ